MTRLEEIKARVKRLTYLEREAEDIRYLLGLVEEMSETLKFFYASPCLDCAIKHAYDEGEK